MILFCPQHAANFPSIMALQFLRLHLQYFALASSGCQRGRPSGRDSGRVWGFLLGTRGWHRRLWGHKEPATARGDPWCPWVRFIPILGAGFPANPSSQSHGIALGSPLCSSSKKNTQTFQKLSVDVPTPCAPRASGSALLSPSPPSARGDGWSWREPRSDLHEGKWSLDVAVARGGHRAGAEPWVPGSTPTAPQ